MKKNLIIAVALIAMMFSTAVFAQTADQTIPLKQGFSFVSFTVVAQMTAQQFKDKSAAIEDIFLYSPNSGTFLSLGSGTLSNVSAGKGYIVKSASDTSVTVSGTAVSTVNNITLKTGFNLIGFSKVPETVTFSQLMARFPQVRGMYKWSPASGVFLQVIRNNNGVVETLSGIDPQITAGQSYFMYLTSDTTLNYDGSTIMVGDGSVTAENQQPSEIPLTALTDIPMPEQLSGFGSISGEIAPPAETAAPGGPDRAIKIVSLVNIKVWIKNKPEISAVTDENGKYELPNVPVAPVGQGHTIEYEKIEGADKFNGVIKNVPVVEKKKIDLKAYIGPAVIKKAGSIQGRLALFDGLSPIGADVYIAGISNMFAKADEDGSFSLMYVPEGTFTLVFSMFGYELTRKEVTVKAGDINQIDRVVLRKVELTSTVGSIDGYIMSDEGIPLSGVLVSLISADGDVDLSTQSSTTGHYEFKNLNAASYKLIFAKDGYKGGEDSLALTTGESKHLNKDLPRIETVSGSGFGLIGGYVKDMITSTPVRNAVVMTIPPTEQFFTDNNGFFSFLIKPGEYTLIIKKAGYIEDRVTLKVIEDQAIEVEGLLENKDTTPVDLININMPQLTMKQGESYQFIATLKDAQGNNIYGRPVAWQVSPETAGKISSTGLFTAEGAGTCEITAAAGGKSVKASVKILSSENSLLSVSLTPEKADIKVEDIKRFTLKATYSDGLVKVILPSFAEWASTQNFYMIENGSFMAVSGGPALVVAKFKGFSATAEVNITALTVDDKAPQVSHKIPAIKIGQPLTVKAEAVDNGGGVVKGLKLSYKKPEDANFLTVDMSKETEGVYIYTIAAGMFTASGIQYYITAEDNAVPANVTVFPAGGKDSPITLKPVSIASITLSKTSDKAIAGENYDLSLITAIIKYSDETTKPVTPVWSIASGNGSITDKNFKAPSVKGTTVLKAAYTEGGYTVNANLNVTIEEPVFTPVATAGKYWTGKVYSFTKAISMLPDFSTLTEQPIAVIQTAKLDVPTRVFDSGFPGIAKNVIENFAIRFTAKLKITEAKEYTFKLNSDDGSKLYINNQLVINNDGLHSPLAKTGKITLAAGEYPIAVEYFQGPRYHIALQLYWQVNGQDVILPDTGITAWDGTKTPSELVLAPASVEKNYGNLNLSTIDCSVKYSDGISVKIAPKWSVVSGGGTIMNGIYMVPPIAGTPKTAAENHTLKASYTENGVTKDAVLTLKYTHPQITNALESIYLSSTVESAFVNAAFDLSLIKVMAKYADKTETQAVSVVWTKKSGEGLLVGTRFTSSAKAGIVVFTANYTEKGVTRTADLTLNVKSEIAVSKVLNTANNNYYAVIDKTMTWKEAKAYCESLGGHLATITSASEQAFVYSLTGNRNCWLGATDETAEGQWKWVTGEAFSYTNWASGQPDNNGNSEHYLHIFLGNAGKWNDLPNAYAAWLPILCCEWEASSAAQGNKMMVDFSSYPEAPETRMNMTVEKYGCDNNPSYKKSLRMLSPGLSYVKFKFDLASKSTAYLNLIHLSSYAAGVLNNGYSPVNIRVNGVNYKTAYSPFSHSYMLDSFDISSLTLAGSNEVIISFDSTAKTHYWLQRVEIANAKTSLSSLEIDTPVISANAGARVDLNAIEVRAVYATGLKFKIYPAWTAKSVSKGFLVSLGNSSFYYDAPATATTSIFTASYTENGVTKTADLTVNVGAAAGQVTNLSDDFSKDLSNWNFLYMSNRRTEITTADGKPSPCILMDDYLNYGVYAKSKQAIAYAGKTVEFSADLMHGNAGSGASYFADQRIALLEIFKSAATAWPVNDICKAGVCGSNFVSGKTNTLYCAVMYSSSGTEKWEEIYVPIANGDGWHNVKIKIRADRKVEFYADGVLKHTSANALISTYESTASFGFGGRKSLYDNLKVVTY